MLGCKSPVDIQCPAGDGRVDLAELTDALGKLNPSAPLSAARDSALDVFLLFDKDRNDRCGRAAFAAAPSPTPLLARRSRMHCLLTLWHAPCPGTSDSACARARRTLNKEEFGQFLETWCGAWGARACLRDVSRAEEHACMRGHSRVPPYPSCQRQHVAGPPTVRPSFSARAMQQADFRQGWCSHARRRQPKPIP